MLDFTTPYTPQLNGKAERLNRTLLDKVRALLFDSSFDKKMWGEALYCLVYILNRLPTDSLECSSYEMWERERSNLNTMQIFGSTAYMRRLGPLKKLEERSKKLYFVGYAPNSYRLWNSKEEKIIIARNVIFGKTDLKENKNNTHSKKIKFIQMERLRKTRRWRN